MATRRLFSHGPSIIESRTSQALVDRYNRKSPSGKYIRASNRDSNFIQHSIEWSTITTRLAQPSQPGRDGASLGPSSSTPELEYLRAGAVRGFSCVSGKYSASLCDGEVGDNHGLVATGGNAFGIQVCRRIAGVTGANQAGLAVIERGGRIGALRSGHEPERWLLDDLPGQKDLRPSFQAHCARWHDLRRAGIPPSTSAAHSNARRVTAHWAKRAKQASRSAFGIVKPMLRCRSR